MLQCSPINVVNYFNISKGVPKIKIKYDTQKTLYIQIHINYFRYLFNYECGINEDSCIQAYRK